MRHWFGAAAAVGLLAAAAIEAGVFPAAAENPPEQLLTFGEVAANGSGPVILRGSAVAPKSAPVATAGVQSYQMAAGERLWFFDPETQEIRSCINQNTITVGLRIVRCYPGSLGGHRRVFGPLFQP